MKEIGSEFWDVPKAEKETALFPEYAQWFLSGRTALKAIIQDLKGCRTAAIPSWCCDSMIKPFLDAGIEIRFYPVYWEKRLVRELRLDCDALLLMDYFGYTEEAFDRGSYQGTIIRDVTHSCFSFSYEDADYYFGSLRKWCGVWTGGYAWKKDRKSLPAGQAEDREYTALRKEAMQEKEAYIRGASNDKEYLKLFEEAEGMLDSAGIVSADSRDVLLARKLDTETIRKHRRLNAQVLRGAFSDMLLFPDMKETDCPMFVPVLIPDNKRNELRKYLIEKGIYCPIHWPKSSLHQSDSRTEAIYQNELSLVCDQRYTQEDMIRVAETVKQFWKEA